MTATILASDSEEVPRPGTLGIGSPRMPSCLGPYDAELEAISARVGIPLELVENDDATWTVLRTDIYDDALGESFGCAEDAVYNAGRSL